MLEPLIADRAQLQQITREAPRHALVRTLPHSKNLLVNDACQQEDRIVTARGEMR